VTFLNWCAGEGFIDSNPAQFTNKHPEVSRERVLTDAELHKIWHTLPNSDFGDIVRLLMLTSQRKSEISDLTRDEINFDQAMITLRPERVKNHCGHYIPLSQPALAILQARPSNNGRNFVFGTGQRGFSGWGAAKRQLDAAVQLTPGWVGITRSDRRALLEYQNASPGPAQHTGATPEPAQVPPTRAAPLRDSGPPFLPMRWNA
jgi:integrase